MSEIKLLFGQLRRNKRAEIFIGNKIDVLLFQARDHLNGVGTRDDHIGKRLEPRGRIDVDNDGKIFHRRSHM